MRLRDCSRCGVQVDGACVLPVSLRLNEFDAAHLDDAVAAFSGQAGGFGV
jgi:hypothetical protein